MNETVRPYRAEDAAAVREVHERAFAGRREEAHLVEMLHAAGAAPVSLVAATGPGGRVVSRVLDLEKATRIGAKYGLEIVEAEPDR